MRALLISIVSALFFAAPAWAASAGAYATSEAANADACARRCADDGLCMMWVYKRPNICELRASVASNLEALAAGVSQRAPQFARTTTVVVAAPQAPAPAPQPAPRQAPHHVALLGGPEADRSGLRARLGDAP